MFCKLQHEMQWGTWYLQIIKARQPVEYAWLDWCNLIGTEVTAKYKIPTKSYVNFRRNNYNESPKSKHAKLEATYGRTANKNTKGEKKTMYRKLKLEQHEHH